MLLSLNWLREFVPYEGTAEELGERLTMLGLELEEIRRPCDGIRDVVVGRVLTCDMHKREHNKSERSKYIRFISLYIFCLLVTVMIIIFLHDAFLAFIHDVTFVIVIRLQAPQSIVVVIRSLP